MCAWITNQHPNEFQSIPTGLRKFGAIVGDRAEIGCDTVISPGSIIGRNSLVSPLTHWGSPGGEQHPETPARLASRDRRSGDGDSSLRNPEPQFPPPVTSVASCDALP